MQIAGDAHAESFHLRIWQEQVGYHDGHHASAGGRADAVMGVFERKTLRGIDAKPVGRLQKGIRIWLSPHIVTMRDDGVETSGTRRCYQRALVSPTFGRLLTGPAHDVLTLGTR